jgi:hypothetical protein
MSGEPAKFSGKDMERWLATRRRYRSKPSPRATLADLQRSTPWVWLWCARCQHHAPLACARGGHPLGWDGINRCAARAGALHGLRPQRRYTPASKLGGRTRRISAVSRIGGLPPRALGYLPD